LYKVHDDDIKCIEENIINHNEEIQKLKAHYRGFRKRGKNLEKEIKK